MDQKWQRWTKSIGDKLFKSMTIEIDTVSQTPTQGFLYEETKNICEKCGKSFTFDSKEHHQFTRRMFGKEGLNIYLCFDCDTVYTAPKMPRRRKHRLV